MQTTRYRPPDAANKKPRVGASQAEAVQQIKSNDRLAQTAVIFEAQIALELCRLDVLRRFFSETRGKV